LRNENKGGLDMYTIELNNKREDSVNFSGKFTAKSPVVEIFSAMVNGKDLSPYGKKADEAAKYIMGLGQKAENGDITAISELNTLRKFVIEPVLLKEMKLLGIFSSYTLLGFGVTVEVETYKHICIDAKRQAEGVDVPFGTIKKEKYQIPTQIISGGFAVNYRQVALGDMSKENEGMEQVKIQIRNNAYRYVIETVINAIKNAKDVKYVVEDAGLTKTNVDALLTKIRRFGKPNVIGDYALVSQFNAWAGYVGTIGTNTITGMSQKLLDEIAQNGILGSYNGSVLSEMPNAYDLTTRNVDGDNFDTVLPTGLGFVVPTGTNSPIKTFTRGGLTSFTGNSVTTGDILTRFDLEVAADVARGQEYKIGLLIDTNLTTL